VLARQAAIRLVKDELKRQGVRVHSVETRDITSLLMTTLQPIQS
jgi:hypothetical protein